jgi:hypothetical protein
MEMYVVLLRRSLAQPQDRQAELSLVAVGRDSSTLSTLSSIIALDREQP